jgi:hypothetical protein
MALKNSHNKSDDSVAETLSKIEIVHLHGRLGYLPWQKQAGRPYGDIRGTGYGLTTHEASQINRHCRITVHPEVDCIGLLRNYVTWT